jgi:hypothetical protein
LQVPEFASSLRHVGPHGVRQRDDSQDEAISNLIENRASSRPRALLVTALAGALSAIGLLAVPALAIAPYRPVARSASQPSPQFSPSFIAGTVDNRAGAFSPETVTIARADNQEELQSIVLRNPPGLLGMLSKAGICSGAQAEAASCPGASEIGTVTVGLGPGFSPFYSAGGVYLTGPYKQAPFGVALAVPVLAGLFEFGEVVVRATLSIDPRTAALSIASDPLPQSLGGIPLQIRTIHLDLAREDFIFNPTSCKHSSIEATVTSTSGTLASEGSPFRATGCAKLAFGPKLDLRLAGQTNRGGHPKLTTVLKMPKGGANLKRVALTLPPTELIDSTHIKSPCTQPQFAADQCPPGSVIGFARAFTPLLKRPIEGPVYLRSSTRKLPDLLVALGGQLDLDLAGRIDTVHGGLRVDFATVPDAPLTKLTLTLDSGRRGLLVNSANLCKAPVHAAAKLAGQNGAAVNQNLLLRTPCARTPKPRRNAG